MGTATDWSTKETFTTSPEGRRQQYCIGIAVTTIILERVQENTGKKA